MQVNRLVRSGNLVARKIGRNWLIVEDPANLNQINFEKTVSLQKWNKLIQIKLKKSLDVETTRDREIMYAKMHSMGLPHERCLAFPFGKFPSLKDFEITVGRIGIPYWISAVPSPATPHLDRLSKLRIYDYKTGWKFINSIPEKDKYKIIVSQYPDDPDFKGTAMISASGKGLAEFITGDRHYIMSRGFTLTDPMLFDQEKIYRFSKTVRRPKQKELFNLVRGVRGFLELQNGKINKKRCLTFMDYNDEDAYMEIDPIWYDLVEYFKEKRKRNRLVVYGLPASPGKAEGVAVVLHHETLGMFEKFSKGDILVSDTTDLGGVTSHAAIVCRELRIPAVVGTRNATEKLRTGDWVGVDADKGIVRILSRD
jgi:phosphohistidine swiveling domain-containing protein